jgi:hypothetical protein
VKPLVARLVTSSQAAQLAAQFGLPGGACSDAHDPDGIGAAYLEMPDFDGAREFLAALAQAEITASTGRTPSATRVARRRRVNCNT